MKNQEIDHIHQRFEAYEDLQSRHLDLLRTNELPDLGQMTLERKTASDDLQLALNKFTENAGLFGGQDNLNVLTRFEARLGSILELDETIGFEIERHRDWLKKELNQLKLGKKAMQGYRPADTPRNKPRVISISR